MTIGQAEQAQQVMFWAEPSQCKSPLFNRVAGQVEVPAGQVNLRGSLPHSASKILEPMLQPIRTHQLGMVSVPMKRYSIFNGTVSRNLSA